MACRRGVADSCRPCPFSSCVPHACVRSSLSLQVRSLESANKLLEVEIEAMRNRYVKPSGLRQMYEAQLKDLLRTAEQARAQKVSPPGRLSWPGPRKCIIIMIIFMTHSSISPHGKPARLILQLLAKKRQIYKL